MWGYIGKAETTPSKKQEGPFKAFRNHARNPKLQTLNPLSSYFSGSGLPWLDLINRKKSRQKGDGGGVEV